MAPKKFPSLGDFFEWLDHGPPASRFDRLLCFMKGNWAALYDALVDALVSDEQRRRAAAPCAAVTLQPTDRVEVPRWVLDALMNELGHSLDGKIGANGKPWVNRYRQDLIDWYRYCQVWYRRLPSDTHAREETPEAQQARLEFFRKQRAAGLDLIDTMAPHPWITSKDHSVDAFEAVATVLKDSTVYGGKPSTIKTSWENVTKALKNGEFWRYYPSKFLRFNGHHADADRNSGR
jgi:hypothetical protein